MGHFALLSFPCREIFVSCSSNNIGSPIAQICYTRSTHASSVPFKCHTSTVEVLFLRVSQVLLSCLKAHNHAHKAEVAQDRCERVLEQHCCCRWTPGKKPVCMAVLEHLKGTRVISNYACCLFSLMHCTIIHWTEFWSDFLPSECNSSGERMAIFGCKALLTCNTLRKLTTSWYNSIMCDL